MTDDSFRNRVMNALNKKRITNKCSLCGENDWSISDQALGMVITNPGGGFSVPPPNVPVAILACNNCGHIRMHSLAALGIEVGKGGA